MDGKAIAKRIVESRLGPNRYSIVGASLGLIAVLLPWVRVESAFQRVTPPAGFDLPSYIWFGTREYSVLELATSDFGTLSLVCALFLIGTLIALMSPVGAIPQMLGLLGFAFNYSSSNLFIAYSASVPEPVLLYGFGLGVASAVIIIQAPMRSMLAANNGKPVRMLGRFAALSPRTISSWR